MPYEAALNKGWDDLKALSAKDGYDVLLLNTAYQIDLKNRNVTIKSSRLPVKDYLAILLLHYQIAVLKGNGPAILESNLSVSGRWLSFKEIPGGEVYYPAFKSSVSDVVLKKYGADPRKIIGCLSRFKGREVEAADVAFEIEPFPGVPIRILLWKADSEFGPEANILFDRRLTAIYPMEDIVVLLSFVARAV